MGRIRMPACAFWGAILLATALFATSGCTERHPRARLVSNTPIGVGLIATVDFKTFKCDGPTPSDPSAANAQPCLNERSFEPDEFRVETITPNVRMIGTRPSFCDTYPFSCRFRSSIEGLTAGTARLNAIIDDGEPIESELGVETILSTVIFPFVGNFNSQFLEQHWAPDAGSVFPRASILLGQLHYSVEAADGEVPPREFLLKGETLFQIASGENLASVGPGPFLSVGADLGIVEVTTGVGGILTVDIVDRSSIAAAAIFDAFSFAPLEGAITLVQGESRLLAVTPFEASGRFIYGDSEEPAYTDTSGALRISKQFGLVGLEYIIEAVAPGVGTLEFSFGNVQTSIGVSVE